MKLKFIPYSIDISFISTDYHMYFNLNSTYKIRNCKTSLLKNTFAVIYIFKILVLLKCANKIFVIKTNEFQGQFDF